MGHSVRVGIAFDTCHVVHDLQMFIGTQVQTTIVWKEQEQKYVSMQLLLGRLIVKPYRLYSAFHAGFYRDGHESKPKQNEEDKLQCP
jgi:hypothetical protein